MNNFLDLTLKSNLYRQSSGYSQKFLNVTLPSLSEHIQKTQMLQSLECYSAHAPSIIKNIKDFSPSLKKQNADYVPEYFELPAVRLRRINSKFEKHLNGKYNQIVDLVKNFLQLDPVMQKYKREGVNYYSRKRLKDFHKFLK
jgi:hypothetical protein